MFKRFDDRIAKHPKFPKIIELPPLDGFIRPCYAQDVESQLMNCPASFLEDLRAVFILSGTRKQLKNYNGSTIYYGHYWRCCIFLHAYPFGRVTLDSLHRFYLRNVLMHELGHHQDVVNTARNDRERFAERFAEIHG